MKLKLSIPFALPQSADPDHVLVAEDVAAACAAARGLPPPPVRAILAKGKPDGIRCARFDWRAAAFVDHGWPPPPPPPISPQPAEPQQPLPSLKSHPLQASDEQAPNSPGQRARAGCSSCGVGGGADGGEGPPLAPAGPSMSSFCDRELPPLQQSAPALSHPAASRCRALAVALEYAGDTVTAAGGAGSSPAVAASPSIH